MNDVSNQALSTLLKDCTPAPWFVSNRASLVVFAGAQCVANTGTHSDNTRDGVNLIEQQESNAKLVALAPTIAAELIKERDVNAKLLEELGQANATLSKTHYDLLKIEQKISVLIKQVEELK